MRRCLLALNLSRGQCPLPLSPSLALHRARRRSQPLASLLLLLPLVICSRMFLEASASPDEEMWFARDCSDPSPIASNDVVLVRLFLPQRLL
jgi:hypothetical protein